MTPMITRIAVWDTVPFVKATRSATSPRYFAANLVSISRFLGLR